MQVLDPLRLTLCSRVLTLHPAPVLVHWPASEVMQRMSVRPEHKPEIPVAELIERARHLRGEGSDAGQHVDPLRLRIEPEQIPRVAMHSVQHLAPEMPRRLPPVVAHVTSRVRVVQPKVVLAKIVA